MKKIPEIINTLSYGEVFGSAGQNFIRLICGVGFSPFQYISFSDQDDIWKPEKLKQALLKIKSQRVGGYSSNVTAFWKYGKTKLIKKSDRQVDFDFLFESPGLGCTFAMTKELSTAIKESFLNSKNELDTIWLHDWYCYFFARFKDFCWYIDPVPMMLYRQHCSNEVGTNFGWKSFSSRYLVIIKGDGFKRVMSQSSFIGQKNLIPIKLIEEQSWYAMFKLSVIAWKCRRQLLYKVFMTAICLVFSIQGVSKK